MNFGYLAAIVVYFDNFLGFCTFYWISNMKDQRYIDEGTDVKESEKGVKNKWRWDWVDHPKPISNKPEDRIPEKDKWRVWLRKLDCPGKAHNKIVPLIILQFHCLQNSQILDQKSSQNQILIP